MKPDTPIETRRMSKRNQSFYRKSKDDTKYTSLAIDLTDSDSEKPSSELTPQLDETQKVLKKEIGFSKLNPKQNFKQKSIAQQLSDFTSSSSNEDDFDFITSLPYSENQPSRKKKKPKRYSPTENENENESTKNILPTIRRKIAKRDQLDDQNNDKVFQLSSSNESSNDSGFNKRKKLDLSSDDENSNYYGDNDDDKDNSKADLASNHIRKRLRTATQENQKNNFVEKKADVVILSDSEVEVLTNKNSKIIDTEATPHPQLEKKDSSIPKIQHEMNHQPPKSRRGRKPKSTTQNRFLNRKITRRSTKQNEKPFSHNKVISDFESDEDSNEDFTLISSTIKKQDLDGNLTRRLRTSTILKISPKKLTSKKGENLEKNRKTVFGRPNIKSKDLKNVKDENNKHYVINIEDKDEEDKFESSTVEINKNDDLESELESEEHRVSETNINQTKNKRKSKRKEDKEDKIDKEDIELKNKYVIVSEDEVKTDIFEINNQQRTKSKNIQNKDKENHKSDTTVAVEKYIKLSKGRKMSTGRIKKPISKGARHSSRLQTTAKIQKKSGEIIDILDSSSEDENNEDELQSKVKIVKSKSSEGLFVSDESEETINVDDVTSAKLDEPSVVIKAKEESIITDSSPVNNEKTINEIKLKSFVENSPIQSSFTTSEIFKGFVSKIVSSFRPRSETSISSSINENQNKAETEIQEKIDEKVDENVQEKVEVEKKNVDNKNSFSDASMDEVFVEASEIITFISSDENDEGYYQKLDLVYNEDEIFIEKTQMFFFEEDAFIQSSLKDVAEKIENSDKLVFSDKKVNESKILSEVNNNLDRIKVDTEIEKKNEGETVDKLSSEKSIDKNPENTLDSISDDVVNSEKEEIKNIINQALKVDSNKESSENDENIKSRISNQDFTLEKINGKTSEKEKEAILDKIDIQNSNIESHNVQNADEEKDNEQSTNNKNTERLTWEKIEAENETDENEKNEGGDNQNKKNEKITEEKINQKKGVENITEADDEYKQASDLKSSETNNEIDEFIKNKIDTTNDNIVSNTSLSDDYFFISKNEEAELFQAISNDLDITQPPKQKPAQNNIGNGIDLSRKLENSIGETNIQGIENNGVKFEDKTVENNEIFVSVFSSQTYKMFAESDEENFEILEKD
ncbi:uncharacterized protein ASCRUDRAFT_68894 [Ascoidea rubescens DSM 1968]|uniref:Uncharacterized protein n=1 Tax=Ascoidea rubescens DSM 1968 TaxID=1344418 RepID=A0A1D2VNE4_9ASCO|nr:hypothetical protein ASCRUDRAFT_68894 [Ascoidea rubescens DSM 1968]ODV63123.1 hypothetical protein ASCRUDRAFT_68894 [Ascoidea rubescens DSM 1968]